jgi:hypothetical protein
VGAGEELIWETDDNEKSRRNAIATEWTMNIRILISSDRRRLNAFAVLGVLCAFRG